MIELKQKHIDLFCAKLPRDIPVNIVFYDLPRYAGAIVRAAVSAGWMEMDGDIGDLKPGKVMKVAKEVIEAYNDSLEISPE